MEYVNLGATGLRVSRVCLGMMSYGNDSERPWVLDEVAAEHDVPAAQVALSWLLHKPGVTAPIVGATKLDHLHDALAAEQLSLDEQEIARLEEPYAPHPVLGHA
jgi:aryl-alcohol dehydrogenase-like predicted oxidoreductase